MNADENYVRRQNVQIRRSHLDLAHMHQHETFPHTIMIFKFGQYFKSHISFFYYYYYYYYSIQSTHTQSIDVSGCVEYR